MHMFVSITLTLSWTLKTFVRLVLLVFRGGREEEEEEEGVALKFQSITRT